MSIRVGELVSQLRTRSRVVNARLGDVRLIADGDEAGTLIVGDERFSWTGRNRQLFAGFLGGPAYKYYEREPLSWQGKVLAHHVSKVADSDSVWYVEGDNIAGIYQPDAKIIPLVAVAERLANVFGPDDMADVLVGPDQVEVNVFSNLRTVTVPGIAGVADRPLDGTVDHPLLPMKVGDLSAGGVRVKMQPGKPERAPVVEENWWRCFCTNQMTRLITGSQINLRGRTVDEILNEMENIARTVFEGLESSARAILHSAETPVPGTVPDFLRVVARERRINSDTIMKLQERALALRPNPSVYDVTQVITAMANEDGVPVLTRRSLQAIGGDLTIDTERMVHRCNTCERPLTAA